MNGLINTECKHEIFAAQLLEIYTALNQNKEGNIQVDDLFDMVADYLKCPSKIWQKAAPDLKRRLQWFEFPEGIVFTGKNFRTSKLCSIYKLLEPFYTLNSLDVTSGDETLNPQKPSTYSNLYPNWEYLAIDLTKLADILKLLS